MPNALAYLALIVWPLVCLILFRRLRPERAVIWSVLGAYLVLPPSAEFDFPLVPDLDKFSISSLCAFLGAFLVLGHRVRLMPRFVPARVLMLGLVLVTVPTVLTNADPLVFRVMAEAEPITFETWRLPGLRLIDILSAMSTQAIMLLPFLLGRFYFDSHKGLREIALALVIAGLVYSLPALFEIRMSPQLNTWIYGFFQHSFSQVMRDGGFRPIVFFPHSLWLVLFFVTALVAAAAFARAGAGGGRLGALAATGYLTAVVVLCKSLAALAYTVALAPVVLLTRARWQIALAMVFGTLAVTWPMLRHFDVVPIDAIVARAEAINPDRAQSLAFRVNNEEQLLERAKEKWLFGWGGWGRNLVRHPETGAIETIPDGRWILTFGTYGWVGYLCEMGLLATPLFLLGWQARRQGAAPLSPFAAPLAMVLAITLVDMLLNDTLVPIVWMIAGAVLGYAERLRFGDEAKAPQDPDRMQPVIGKAPAAAGRRTHL